MNNCTYAILQLSFFICLGCIILSCKDLDKSNTPNGWKEKRKKEPVSESFNVDYVYTELGRLKAKLKMKHIYEMPEEEMEVTYMVADKGADIRFFNELGQLETVLTSQTAKIYKRKTKALFTGNVVVRNSKNEKLETEELEWDKIGNRIYSTKAVKITTADEIIFGEGFESDTEFKNYSILKTRGTISIKDNVHKPKEK